MLLLPPAPAARVLAGLAFAALSALSAAAFLRIAVFGPPGGVGDDGRAVLEPVDCGEFKGDEGRGDDWFVSSIVFDASKFPSQQDKGLRLQSTNVWQQYSPRRESETVVLRYPGYTYHIDNERA